MVHKHPVQRCVAKAQKVGNSLASSRSCFAVQGYIRGISDHRVYMAAMICPRTKRDTHTNALRGAQTTVATNSVGFFIR